MELLLLIVAGIFLIGCGTTIWLIVKAFLSIFSSSTPSRPLAPAPTQNRGAAAAARGLTRQEMLVQFRDELFEAVKYNQISAAAFREVRDYIEIKLKPAARASIEAQAAARATEELPLIALIEKAQKEEKAAQGTATVAAPPKPAFDDPERIRSVYARLRAHSEAPAPVEAPVKAAEVTAPVEKPVMPAPKPKVVTPVPPMPRIENKPLAERLFTPENVRILQSLGICIIFLSTVAFVRTKMWESASGMAQIALLVLGTAACMGLGFSLRKWTSLRITGLGFLILGQLSLIIDTYAILFSNNTEGLYPYSQSSLWTFSFMFFTMTAYVQSRTLKEPLFDAFAFFGAIAAWVCGIFWSDVNPWLMPAALVPLVLIFRSAASFLAPESFKSGRAALQRWSLPWWMEKSFASGAPILAAVVLGAAFYSGRTELAHSFNWHCAAMVMLAAGFLIHSWRNSRQEHIHAAAVLLLAPTLLFAYTHAWPVQNWMLALVIPGMVLALAGLMPQRRSDNRSLRSIIAVFSGWGLASTAVALTLTVIVRLSGVFTHDMTLTCVCALVVALAYAAIERALWTPWVAVFIATFMCTLFMDTAHISRANWPSVWLAMATLVFVFSRKTSWVFNQPDLSFDTHLGAAGHVLAGIAACILLGMSPIFIGSIAEIGVPLVAGWFALTFYVLMISAVYRSPMLRGVGIALLTPALTFTLYHAGFSFAQPAPYLAGLVLLVIAAATFVERIEQPSMLNAAITGSAFLLGHAAFFAVWQYCTRQLGAAEVSFGVLAAALAAVALRLRTRESIAMYASYFETVALIAVAAIGFCELPRLKIDGPMWSLAVMFISAGVIAMACIGQLCSHVFKTTTSHPDDKPFRTAGEIVALMLMTIAGGALVLHTDKNADHELLLNLTWVCALFPIVIALRPRRSPESEWARLTGASTAILLLVFAAGQALYAEFWTGYGWSGLREACARFFAVLLLLTFSLVSYCVRSKDSTVRSFAQVAPFSGMFALLSLIGCAYGAFSILPVESFGLCCAILACGAWGLAGFMRGQSSVWLDTGLTSALRIVASLTFAFGSAFLLQGLGGWNAGTAHLYAVAAWLLGSAGIWFHYSDQPRHTRRSALAGLSLTLAAMHTMRFAAIPFAKFGPWMIAVAAGLLAIRQYVIAFTPKDDTAAPPERLPASLHGRAGGLIWASGFTAVIGIVLGFWGWIDGYMWHTCATLAEIAFGIAGLTILARRENRENLPVNRILTLELVSWLLLALAIAAGTNVKAANIPMDGAWILVAALFLLIGMAAEALLGAMVPRKQDEFPGVFLESRHLAAFTLGIYNVLAVVLRPESLSSSIDATWRAIFSAAGLAVYGSFARCSVSESMTDAMRKVCGVAAYMVLLPLGYLLLLKAHSTGSSWGAMYFMLLAPVLLAAAYVLYRENQHAQSSSAKLGALFVNLGSLVLAYFGNRENLAAVPALAFSAVALQALLMRLWTREREFTIVTSILGTIGAFYAMRGLAGFPAWGTPNPWAWEMVAMGGLGLALLVLGSLFSIEADEKGQSYVAKFGAWLNSLATAGCLLHLMAFGMAAKYAQGPNTQRFDALVACLVLSGVVSMLSRSTLEFELGRYGAPACFMSAYFLAVWKQNPQAWEWYSLPAAAFMFGWAWHLARDGQRRKVDNEAELSLFIVIASALAVVPSFIQAIPGLFEATALHFFVMLGIGIAMTIGAMIVRRKIPLLFASSAIVLGTLIQAIHWAQHQRVLLPVIGIAIGFAVLALGSLFESRMNQVFRQALDRAKAEARMFWVSWQ